MTGTARSNRYYIAVFGRRNAGKSSLVNSLVGQEVSIVSDVPGTTTDTVWKNIELPGIGAAVIADTAGFDDEGVLGSMRVDAARKVLLRTNLALLMLGDNPADASFEKEWIAQCRKLQLPVLPVAGKCDKEGGAELRNSWESSLGEEVLSFSAATGAGLDALLERMAECSRQDDVFDDITAGLAEPGDVVVLVMPQDAQAPQGRVIQPQVQTLRNLLDKHCIAMCCTPEELLQLLRRLTAPPTLVITDSQVFGSVEKIVPKGVQLTSFSVLMARQKGDIETFIEGARALMTIPANGRILIAEACAHVPGHEDIGRVKLPALLRSRLGSELSIDVVSGNDFPEELSGYSVVIHCGACMFTRRHVMSRVAVARNAGVPVTNYGIAIAALLGIIDKIVY